MSQEPKQRKRFPRSHHLESEASAVLQIRGHRWSWVSCVLCGRASACYVEQTLLFCLNPYPYCINTSQSANVLVSSATWHIYMLLAAFSFGRRPKLAIRSHFWCLESILFLRAAS